VGKKIRKVMMKIKCGEYRKNPDCSERGSSAPLFLIFLLI
jgi:hypothetical protein